MGWKDFSKEHRSNLFFYLLGCGGTGSIMGAFGHAIANSLHGHPTDWILFALFVVFGAALLIIGLWLRTEDHNPAANGDNAIKGGSSVATPENEAEDPNQAFKDAVNQHNLNLTVHKGRLAGKYSATLNWTQLIFPTDFKLFSTATDPSQNHLSLRIR